MFDLPLVTSDELEPVYTNERILECLASFKKGTAPDGVGWTAEAAMQITHSMTNANWLRQALLRVEEAPINSVLAKCLRTSVLIPLKKNLRCDVRPIAVPMLMHKCRSKLVLSTLTQAHLERFSDYQHGIQKPHGVSTLVTAVQSFAALHESWTFVQLDMGNAFGSASRQEIVRQLNAVPSPTARLTQKWLCSQNIALGPVSESESASLIS